MSENGLLNIEEAVDGVAEDLEAGLKSVRADMAYQGRQMRAAVILAGLLAERSQAPLSYSQMVSKAAGLATALERELNG